MDRACGMLIGRGDSGGCGCSPRGHAAPDSPEFGYDWRMNFGDYIVYIDESGDHGLTNINPDHPVFVLAFCVVEKTKYIDKIVPAFQRLKFDFWGHDSVVLHSHEIRKATGDFNILLNSKTRSSFIDRVTALIGEVEFTLIVAVIDKKKHVEKYTEPADPYAILARNADVRREF